MTHHDPDSPPSSSPAPSAPGPAAAPVSLCPADCAALEALCGCALDCASVPAEHARRAQRLMALLNRVGDSVPEADRDLLIDVTCALVDRARRDSGAELSPRDEDALEALVAAGMDPARVPAALRPRARRHADLLAVLDVREPIAPDCRDALVSRTLAYVSASAQAADARMTITPEPETRGFRPRWAELISVAAILLLSGAVLTPILSAARGYQQRASCQANMSAAGLGFGLYANDFQDALPLASSSPAGHPWWNVGDPTRSNSANLYTMVRTSYSTPDALACAGNPTALRTKPEPAAADWRSLDQVSYSYQNLFARERPRWTQPTTLVILADRSPVIPLAIRGLSINPLDNSLNHAGRGQTVLFNDGSSRFLRTPVLGTGDNIWLPRQIEQLISVLRHPAQAEPLRGTEAPAAADDVFLGP